MLIITVKVGGLKSGVQICKITNVFLHQIKLNWHGWSPQRVHEHSMSSLSNTAHGVPMECSWSAHGLHGLHVECSWTAHGLHVECRKYSHGVLMDCSWIAHTAHGVLMECSWSPWEGVGECKVLPRWHFNIKIRYVIVVVLHVN